MKRSVIRAAGFLALTCALPGSAGAADVHIGINVGVPPPPPVVIETPPQMVVVPATPAVRYAPEVGVNLFFYGGQYWTFHQGGWFVAPAYSGPWVYVEPVHVPRPVLIVPARYYKIPPGHMRMMYGHPHGKHHGHGDWDDEERHEHHGRGHHHDDD